MSKQEFKIGDIVRLRSGGPWMTVTDMPEDASIKVIFWNEFTGTYKREVFESGLLIDVQEL